jgi:hypothetical protein
MAALASYLYAVGFAVGTAGAQRTISVGHLCLTLVVAPFTVIPAPMGIAFIAYEGVYAAIGTLAAALVFVVAWNAIVTRRWLRGWRAYAAGAGLAYLLGFAVQFGLMAVIRIAPPPMAL